MSRGICILCTLVNIVNQGRREPLAPPTLNQLATNSHTVVRFTKVHSSSVRFKSERSSSLRLKPSPFCLGGCRKGQPGLGASTPYMPRRPMLQARWQTTSARNNSAWIILRPLCPPIPCANDSAPYVRPYIPPHIQRMTWKPHTYKRAALLLIVLALHIDSRRNAPTPYTLSSVTYRPRIPTPCKDNQRATHTPQIPAPLQARRCTSLLACFPACYPACIQPTEQRLHGLPWKDRNRRAYHPPTLATNAANGSTA